MMKHQPKASSPPNRAAWYIELVLSHCSEGSTVFPFLVGSRNKPFSNLNFKLCTCQVDNRVSNCRQAAENFPFWSLRQIRKTCLPVCNANKNILLRNFFSIVLPQKEELVVFHRGCYAGVFDLFYPLTSTLNNVQAIITGTPGIGKSHSFFSFLRMYLLRKNADGTFVRPIVGLWFFNFSIERGGSLITTIR